MTESTLPLQLVAPEVMGVRASQQPVAEPHLNWYVDYAPERDDDLDGRVVFGQVHGAAANGYADVTVASVMRYAAEDEPGTEEFASALENSDALETLWDIARVAFRTIAALTGLDVELPAKAPQAEISQLVPSDEANESDKAGQTAPDS